MTASAGRTIAQNTGLLLGIVAFVATLAITPPAGMTPASWHVAGVMVLMALWWSTEAIPLAATALVPIAVLPPLGAVTASRLAEGYGNSTLYLILGGFVLALAMERCNLHRRIAYTIVSWAGGHPQGLVLGMMCATGFVSMWVQNTSTALMMLPVAISVAAIVAPDAEERDRDTRNFSTAIVICVAYGATIGGLGTLVGTPTNALVAGFMQQNYGETISFAQWLAFGIPTVLLLMPLAWLVLVRLAFPFRLGSQSIARDRLRLARAELGPMSAAERRVTTIFLLTAAAWLSGPLLRQLPALGNFSDTTIALLAALSFFAIPSGMKEGGHLVGGAELRRIPWEVLLLFGGGLALAEAIQGSGLSEVIGEALSVVGAWPLLALVATMVTLLIFWTELNSNVATAATFMPILAAIAATSNYPVLLLVAPAAVAASCAFMLPIGTPPNAIVFGSGRIQLRDMLRAGWLINLAAIAVVTLVSMLVLPLIA